MPAGRCEDTNPQLRDVNMEDDRAEVGSRAHQGKRAEAR